MFGLLDLIAFLLITVGWCLITLAVRDIVVTVQMSIKAVRENNGLSFYYYSLSCRIISRLLQLINSSKRWRFILSKAHILFPVIQIILWNLLLIAGFAFVYLAPVIKPNFLLITHNWLAQYLQKRASAS